MQAIGFWKTVVADKTDFLGRFISLVGDEHIRFCVVGGQAVNAYVEPLVSLDLDLVVAANHLPKLEQLLMDDYRVERFPHSLNVSAPGSDLRIQIQMDPRYSPFVDRAELREVLGIEFPVARIEDVLQGKVWAALDAQRRPSERRKDLLDIERLLEAYPSLRGQVPAEILSRLEVL
jgi:hypothetical protein